MCPKRVFWILWNLHLLISSMITIAGWFCGVAGKQLRHYLSANRYCQLLSKTNFFNTSAITWTHLSKHNNTCVKKIILLSPQHFEKHFYRIILFISLRHCLILQCGTIFFPFSFFFKLWYKRKPKSFPTITYHCFKFFLTIISLISLIWTGSQFIHISSI